jgi:hypothetical protein
MYSLPYKSEENSKKNLFESIDLYRKGHAFLGHVLCKGPKHLLKTWGLWVSKDEENVD